MSYGLKFATESGYRVIDENAGRIIPQFIGKVSLNGPNGYIDYYGGQPGYMIRSYRDYTPSVFNNRPCILFWSMPAVNADVWYMGGSAVVYGNGVNPNWYPHPECYAFALDYVSASAAKWGCRIYGPGGSPLIYDSGIPALNIHQIIPSLYVRTNPGPYAGDPPTGEVAGFWPPKGIPGKPAIVMPSVRGSRTWAQRFGGYGDWDAQGLVRVFNGQLQTKFLTTSYSYTEEENQRVSYNNVYVDGQSQGYIAYFDTMMIDASIYD